MSYSYLVGILVEYEEVRTVYGSDETSWKVESRDVGDDFDCCTVVDSVLLQISKLLGHISQPSGHISKLIINLCSL